MARSRVGGSRAKLRGAVGSDIYQIAANADGKLQQVVYSRTPERKYSNSDLQVRNRMIMGQVERMFHILPSVISSGFFNTDSGAMSFQRFSRLNYRLLRDDYKDHFEGNPCFDWQSKRALFAPAGPWVLTDGRVQPIVWQRVKLTMQADDGAEFWIDTAKPETTVGELLALLNVSPGDSLVLFLFCRRYPDGNPWVRQVIFKVSDEVDLNHRLIDTYEGEVICPADESISNAGLFLPDGGFFLWVDFDTWGQNIVTSCYSWLVVRPAGNKTLFSPAVFAWADDSPVRKYHRASPSEVFDSWKYR